MKFYLLRFYFVILILIPLILIFLPANFFDSGDSVCLSIMIFDKECYACGMTRAIQHLIHLDFAKAISFNKLSILVFPLLIVSYFKEIRRIYRVLF
tara:strand:- start:674 stop:961 length:288 start_codon:yes stop_codon:yes gene_type:complete